MSYEVICNGEHAYGVPMIAESGDNHGQPEKEAEKLRKEIRDGHFKYADVDLQIKLTCFDCDIDGSIFPTPEWNRILKQLSKVDGLESEIKDVRQNKNLIKEAYDKVAAELMELKSRLPKNADGDVVLWGDEQVDSVEDYQGTVISIERQQFPVNGVSGLWTFRFDTDEEVYNKDSHSMPTAKSAQTEGEGA